MKREFEYYVRLSAILHETRKWLDNHHAAVIEDYALFPHADDGREFARRFTLVLDHGELSC